MYKSRVGNLIACALAVCVFSACEKDVDKQSGAGGAFLQPQAGAADELWHTGDNPPAAPTYTLEELVPPGERATFVEVDARGAFGGEIRPRDRVDLVLITEVDRRDRVAPGGDDDETKPDEQQPERSTKSVSMTLLQNLTVLRSERSGRQDDRWVLTVSATPDEARLLETSQAAGEFMVLLRNHDDIKLHVVHRRTIPEVLEDLEVLNRTREQRQQKYPPAKTVSTQAPLSRRVDPDMRALSLPIELSAPVARHVEPGAFVDISGLFELGPDDRILQKNAASEATGEFVSMTLVQNVRVLAKIDPAPDDESTDEDDDSHKDDRADIDDASSRPGSPILVVEVTDDEAQTLALSAKRGDIKVQLRGENDHEITSVQRKTTRQVIEDLEVIHRRREVRLGRLRRPSGGSHKIQILRGNGSGGSAGSPAQHRWPPRTVHVKRQHAQTDSSTADERDRDVQIHKAEDTPLSTFALDVDTSSYTQARRHLQEGDLPAEEEVRVEEFVNYFDYDNPWPTTKPFAVTVEGAPSPFRRSKRHKLVRIGVQAKQVSPENRIPVNLTFLVDTSHSMQGDDRLGLVKKALIELTKNLEDQDSIAIVGYSNRVDEILGRTSAKNKSTIVSAIHKIRAYGTTNMEAGMRRAYRLAHERLDSGAENRVIVLSDGDPNVGASSHQELLASVADEREEGITMSTIGFGRGNYRDTLMEQLADNGDGNSFYVDTQDEAERLFGERLLSTVITVARDVKAQVEFDPDVVDSYRRVGYANRALSEDDWHDPEVDAGEIGAGHRITVLYEVMLAEDAQNEDDKALGTVRVRYKMPSSGDSFEIATPLGPKAMNANFEEASTDLRFAASVVGFAEVLGGGPLGQYLSLEQIGQTAKKAAGGDPARQEFVELVERTRSLREAKRVEEAKAEQARSSREKSSK